MLYKLVGIIFVVGVLFLAVGKPINGDQDYFKETEHSGRLAATVEEWNGLTPQVKGEAILYTLAGFVGLLIWACLLQLRVKAQEEFDFERAQEETRQRNIEQYGSDIEVCGGGIRRVK